MKKSHGTYKLTLYRLFFAIVLATALIVCTLIGWFLNRQSKSDYSHYLEQSANSQKKSVFPLCKCHYQCHWFLHQGRRNYGLGRFRIPSRILF